MADDPAALPLTPNRAAFWALHDIIGDTFDTEAVLRDLRAKGFTLDATRAATPAAPEALRAFIDRWVPQHAYFCADQDDDAECVCGVGPEYERLLASTGDAPVNAEPLDGQTWRCPSCRDTTAPMGMCEKCGVFGLRYEPGTYASGYVAGYKPASRQDADALVRALSARYHARSPFDTAPEGETPIRMIPEVE